jgi:hypothetical protein
VGHPCRRRWISKIGAWRRHQTLIKRRFRSFHFPRLARLLRFRDQSSGIVILRTPLLHHPYPKSMQYLPVVPSSGHKCIHIKSIPLSLSSFGVFVLVVVVVVLNDFGSRFHTHKVIIAPTFTFSKMLMILHLTLW